MRSDAGLRWCPPPAACLWPGCVRSHRHVRYGPFHRAHSETATLSGVRASQRLRVGVTVQGRPRRRCQANVRMERIAAAPFAGGGNDAVVRLPGRRFPGVLVQGDFLHVPRSAVRWCRPARDAEAGERAARHSIRTYC
ncbi:DUF6959 family protein [Streptomyces sp. NPDC101152]|uniref:DUF6959 family protein n=1 Tax=Streptomyces sp. NPDC101152 TaxID=3366116 RepID=UPI0037F51FF7